MQTFQHVMLVHCGRRGPWKTLGVPRAQSSCPNPSFRGRSFASIAHETPSTHEVVELPIGVSGRIKLEVITPTGSLGGGNESRHLLVYLPPGPSIGRVRLESIHRLPYLQGLLSPTTSLVTINYRLGSDQDDRSASKDVTRFPIPIHDVATAFAHLTSSTSQFNKGQHEAPSISLFGSHIGGALAAMLALTEPNDVKAVAVVEPMVDWVGLEEVLEQLRSTETASILKKRQPQKSAARYGNDIESVIAATEELAKLRARLFPTPSSYFDPFASPVLFLRAPGRDTPLVNTAGDLLVREMASDVENAMDFDNDTFDAFDHDRHKTSSSDPPSPVSIELSATGQDTAKTDALTERPPRRRKVLRRWPAVARSDSVTLPYVKVFVQSPPSSDPDQLPQQPSVIDTSAGHAALMRAQGTEFAELLRRACFFGREKGFAEERVQLHEEGADHVDHIRASTLNTGDVKTKMQRAALKWIKDVSQRE